MVIDDGGQPRIAFSTLLLAGLNSMRRASGEELQVAGRSVIHIRFAIGLHHADTCFACQHNGPLISEMPVQFAEHSRFQAHTHAIEVLRRASLWEVIWASNHRLAAASVFCRSNPTMAQVSGTHKRWHVRGRILLQQGRISGPGSVGTLPFRTVYRIDFVKSAPVSSDR